MRVEYMRTLASAHRWPEEVDLLTEEMARTLVFFTYEEAVWLQRVLGATRGRRAFALRQARERRRIRAHFQRKWAVFGDSQALEVALDTRRARKLKLKQGDSQVTEAVRQPPGSEDEGDDDDGEGED